VAFLFLRCCNYTFETKPSQRSINRLSKILQFALDEFVASTIADSRMARRIPPLADIYQALLARFGPQAWWPGESPTEVVVGAVLVQNTAWRNVERAV